MEGSKLVTGVSNRCSPKDAKLFMNYFDFYYAYLEQCEKENRANMRDPDHDFMEWNHTLPQCLFGDQPVGQWLTLKQHAIASALQTLAFRTKCVGGFHKSLMPEKLWELCLPYTQSWGSQLGSVYGQENVELGRGFWSQTPEQWAETCRKGGETAGRNAVLNQTGIHINDPEKRKEWASQGGQKGKGKLYWNNGVENKRSTTCPGEGWQRGIITNRWKKDNA